MLEQLLLLCGRRTRRNDFFYLARSTFSGGPDAGTVQTILVPYLSATPTIY